MSGAGFELVEAVLEQRGRRQVVRIVIHSEAGVTLGDCERVTRAAGSALETANSIPGSYVLEVSSPGVDRVLKSAREFDLFRGKRVRLRLAIEGNEPEREVFGTCDGTREGNAVAIRDEEGAPGVIPWTSVSKARLEPEPVARAKSEGRGA